MARMWRGSSCSEILSNGTISRLSTGLASTDDLLCRWRTPRLLLISWNGEPTFDIGVNVTVAGKVENVQIMPLMNVSITCANWCSSVIQGVMYQRNVCMISLDWL